MHKQTPIKVKLFVVLGDGHFGPIDLTIWGHHTPQAMTVLEMDEPLAIPPQMRTTTQRFLYSVRRRSKLKPGDNYRDQDVTEGDILILTDQQDDEMVFTVAHALADSAEVRPTEAEIQETRFKAVVRAALEGIPYVGGALAALICGPRHGR